MFVITADQRDSRTSADLVPEGIALVERVGGRPAHPSCAAQRRRRTAGADRQRCGRAARSDWRCCATDGGAWASVPGRSSRPCLPTSAPHAAPRSSSRGRPSSGPSPLRGRVAVAAADPVAAADAEAYLRLLVDLRDRRSAQGWEVADLLAQGLTQKRIAAELGITPTAVSLRAKAAGLRLEEAAIPALERTLAAARPVTRVCPSVVKSP